MYYSCGVEWLYNYVVSLVIKSNIYCLERCSELLIQWNIVKMRRIMNEQKWLTVLGISCWHGTTPCRQDMSGLSNNPRAPPGLLHWGRLNSGGFRVRSAANSWAKINFGDISWSTLDKSPLSAHTAPTGPIAKRTWTITYVEDTKMFVILVGDMILKLEN